MTQQKGANHLAWFAYAAAAWSFIFALISFYWAAGGTIGLNTLGDEINSLKGNAWFTTFVWLTGILKVAAGLIALSLVGLFRVKNMHRLINIAAWGIGIFLTLYSGANLAARAAMKLGWLVSPETMHSAAAYWHLVLWDPFWLLGGVLFLGCARLSLKPGKVYTNRTKSPTLI